MYIGDCRVKFSDQVVFEKNYLKMSKKNVFWKAPVETVNSGWNISAYYGEWSKINNHLLGIWISGGKCNLIYGGKRL